MIMQNIILGREKGIDFWSFYDFTFMREYIINADDETHSTSSPIPSNRYSTETESHKPHKNTHSYIFILWCGGRECVYDYDL